ncbi:leucine-rich repeat protein [Phocaeicola sartorii]|uniref:BACON domain-containing protein n=1 Tax=Phocaeicola sartorii TaxID=671267 RepID=R9HXP5_9BACT|nr:leucine-rich repeat protein [Phocaeicola sartorii]EOS08767.1 hypothetical protein C802_04378 [Phocaeicola sartorii]MCR1846595.1 leucine-rich repeat protein [Phocaeicola sartorii]
MKTTIEHFHIYLLFIATVLFTACSDKDESPVITPDTDSEIYFTDAMNFNSNGGVKIFKFATNKNWTISIANTVNGSRWCTVSQDSGKAGTISIEVSASKNEGYDDRSIALTIQAGDLKRTIMITQKQKDALTLTTDRFEIDREGGIIEVEIKSNIDYQIIIAEKCKSWITQHAPSSTSRALNSKKQSFDIAPSEEYDKREGEIYIKSNDKVETIHIYQTGGGILLLSQNNYAVSDKGETISVDLKSNAEYGVIMPNVAWIKEATSRSASTHTLLYTISPNETHDNRSAEIVYYDKNSDLSDTLKIKQVQKDAIILSKKEYTVSPSGEVLEIELNSNVEIEVTTDDNWITSIETPESRALVNHKLFFQIAANETKNARNGHIFISNANKSVSETISISQGIPQLKNIHVEKAGTLPDYITADEKYKITSLILSGELNGTDIRFLREMAGSDVLGKPTQGVLAVLDMTEAKIVKGGDYYYNHYNKYQEDNPYHQYYLYYDNDIPSFSFKNCHSLKSVSIPNTATIISNSAFSECTSLESVKLPDSLIKIEGAFYNCSSLKTIQIPNSVKEIGGLCFGFCSSLTSVKLPDNIASIPFAMFADCSSLTDIQIPNSVKAIDNSAFSECYALTSIRIPEGITRIESGTFHNCESLVSVDIPQSVTFIGKDAFYNCQTLPSLNLPDNITTIQEWAFSSCDSLKSIHLPSKLTSIDKCLFNHCSSLTSIDLPEGITRIDTCAFQDCYELKSVKIPNTVQSIYWGTFIRCYKLSEVSISKSLARIPYAMFYGCITLENITIPQNVTEIEGKAFYACWKLKSITIEAIIPPTFIIEGNRPPFEDEDYKELTLYVPDVEAYRKAEVWKNFETIKNIKDKEKNSF